MTARRAPGPGAQKNPASTGALGPAPAGRTDRADRADPAATGALYRCTVRHVRTGPVRHVLRHRSYLWLVDLDRLPLLPRPLRPLARFEPRDHFGGTAPTLRAAVDRFLTAQGEPVPDGPVLMLANARVLGYVFNPLSLYWCYRADGRLGCVIAEVHNTYGERHAYLLHTDDQGRAETAKEFYVSPFNPVDGSYRMRVPPPGERLELTVQLDRPSAGGEAGGGTGAFTATVRGHRTPAGTAGLLRAAVRHPWPTLGVAAGIRLHGVLLWLRGLPVRPRPRHQTQKGME